MTYNLIKHIHPENAIFVVSMICNTFTAISVLTRYRRYEITLFSYIMKFRPINNGDLFGLMIGRCKKKNLYPVGKTACVDMN